MNFRSHTFPRSSGFNESGQENENGAKQFYIILPLFDFFVGRKQQVHLRKYKTFLWVVGKTMPKTTQTRCKDKV